MRLRLGGLEEAAAAVAKTKEAKLQWKRWWKWQQWQRQHNDVLNDDDVSSSPSFVQYSKALFQWNIPFCKTASSPFAELKKAKQFYNRANIAILSESSSNEKEMSLRWEISLLWPSPWEPHVLLTGTSKLTLDVKGDDNSITILSQ